MTNPFETRATEYLRDETAFLSVVTPEPLHTFFEKHAITGALFDRLALVIGTPGSGKTTIASLVQFRIVDALINNPNHSEYRPLKLALSRCQILDGEIPKVLGCRIPMESEYRDFWELPYDDEIKFGLLRAFLQARAVISWIKNLEDTGQYDLAETKFIYRDGMEVAGQNIGGTGALELLNHAREVERIVYGVSAALIPPSENCLPMMATAPYQPFDAIESILAARRNSLEKALLRPLVVLDDVHALHPRQLSLMRDWLARREMRISRWMLMRLDAQTPEAVLNEVPTGEGYLGEGSTINGHREITVIWLQSSEDRGVYRKKFRAMAQSMADKYLRLMPVFSRQGLARFSDLLNTQPTNITNSSLKKLSESVDAFQRRSNIGSEVRSQLDAEVSKYFLGSNRLDDRPDVRLAMVRILLHRYVKRVPQASLFDSYEENNPPQPSKPITADAGVADGARIFLLHEFNRPYYFGIDSVCDGSSENAEKFLHLAGRLVSASEARIIRGERSALSSSYQDRLIRQRANEMIQNWAFPRHAQVKQICEIIAQECLEKSLEPNASLGGGANAFGIPEEEFLKIPFDNPDLANVMKFGIAYNALSIKRRHKTKKRLWTLVELTGPYLIKTGLTFSRGGFLERNVNDLWKPLKGEID